MKKQTIYLCRHGETAWSSSGQHTSFSDIPLTENGNLEAKALGKRIEGIEFTKVFSSPLLRAKHTAELAGLGKQIEVRDELFEWRYGDYEGKTTSEIRKTIPDWTIFGNGAPGGESSEDVTVRAKQLIEEIRSLEGNIALFSHGHFSRAFAACWIGLTAAEGRFFKLKTAAFSRLGYERECAVIEVWNDTSHFESR